MRLLLLLLLLLLPCSVVAVAVVVVMAADGALETDEDNNVAAGWEKGCRRCRRRPKIFLLPFPLLLLSPLSTMVFLVSSGEFTTVDTSLSLSSM
jgi:hypothetical protein